MSLSAQEVDAGWNNDRIGTVMVEESANLRVWQMHLAPGESIAPHRHDRPYLWTVVTAGKGVSRFDDGREEAITYKVGDCGHFPDLDRDSGFVHDLTNVGDTSLVFVSVEFNPAPADIDGIPAGQGHS